MAVSQSSEALRRPLYIMWVAFPVLALLSLVFGYLGFEQFLMSNNITEYGRDPVDLAYYDLQLFVLGADPLQSGQPRPLLLQIARFTAPAVTVYAAAEAIRLLLAVELSRFRARRARGHAVVCGDSPLADALTRRLQRDGTTVVEIRRESDEYVSRGEPLRVLGDARDPDVLREAGVGRATTVFACAADAATNIAIALAVYRSVDTGTGGELQVHCLVNDPDFCTAVQAYFLTAPRPGRVRLDFFTVDHIAARKLISLDDAATDYRPGRLLIEGTDAFARAVVVESALRWRTQGPPDRRLQVTLVGPDAHEVVDSLGERYPFLAQVCDLHPVEEAFVAALLGGRLPDPPERVLITCPDENQALKLAMNAERYWRGRSGRITVRLDGALIGRPGESGRLELSPGRLDLFGPVAAAGDPDLIRDDLLERLARVLHDHYRLGRRARGDAAAPSDRALMPWDELPAALRQANRSQAEDLGHELAALGYAIIPRYGGQHDAPLPEADLQRLARLEHDRWCREQRAAGWKYDPQFDEERKLHPGLQPWERLPETMRMRNFDPFRDLPRILADAGFRIARPVITSPDGEVDRCPGSA